MAVTVVAIMVFVAVAVMGRQSLRRSSEYRPLFHEHDKARQIMADPCRLPCVELGNPVAAPAHPSPDVAPSYGAPH